MTRLVDLSHTVEHGLQTYPGLPAPRVGSFLTHAESEPRYAPGTTFHIGSIEMVSNTGTYLDSPFHRFSEGADLSQLRNGYVSGAGIRHRRRMIQRLRSP